MKHTVVVGAQWGDEGKGKIVDLLAGSGQYAACVRFNGGANAGHTIRRGDKKIALHQIPSGAVHGLPGVIGNGMVLNLQKLDQELQDLTEFLGKPPSLFISDKVHLVEPEHLVRDQMEEVKRAEETGKALGTCQTGNGPAYADKYSRHGLRMGQLWGCGKHENGITVVDTVGLIHGMAKQGLSLLFEGAHGTMLDIDHGDYPYVTSSNCICGAVSTGAGFPAHMVHEYLGVVKAYSTRVAAGEFRTECDGKHADYLRERGHEYGSTTGRPRRIGWLDLDMLSYSCMLNGFTQLAITMLDVLDEMDTIPYMKGNRLQLAKGWKANTSWCKGLDELPYEARKYVDLISETCNVPVRFISVGPDPSETIYVD